MTVIYKREKLGQKIQEMLKSRYASGTRRNLSIRRCLNKECMMMFETLKRYPKQICTLCRIEQSKSYKKVALEKWREKGKGDLRALYQYHTKKHKKLLFYKDNLNKALKCTVTNQVECKRNLEKYA